MVHIVFNYIVSRRALHPAHWLKGCLFLLVGLSSCARSSDLGVKTQVCFFPGMGNDSPHYTDFKKAMEAKLPSGSDDEVGFDVFPVNWHDSVENIQKKAAEDVEEKFRTTDCDKLIVGGHSFGGLIGAGLTAKKYHDRIGLSGIFTINSPMNGVVLSSPNDRMSNILVNIAAGSYSIDLRPDSGFIHEIRSAVTASDVPVLSFASRCNVSAQLHPWVEMFTGLKDNLHDSDGVLKVSTQSAVKDWRKHKDRTNAPAAVVLYENHVHDNDLVCSVPFFGNLKLSDAPSILDNTELHETVSAFVQFPEAIVDSLASKALPADGAAFGLD